MGFLSVCTALYDYSPQAEGELSIQEGDLLYILEKSSEEDWWKAKKKVPIEIDDEPVGLIPNNYVEEAQPKYYARALYDYSRQTDEELSFSEDATLTVFDTSDPEWTLVGLNSDYGFAPANYIELTEKVSESAVKDNELSPSLPTRTQADEQESVSPPLRPPNPAESLASIIGQQPKPPDARQTPAPLTPASDDADVAPTLPQRPASQKTPAQPDRQLSPPTSTEPAGVLPSQPHRAVHTPEGDIAATPGGFHLYNVNEMVLVMGKQKKMPTTLGINLATGKILIIPEKKRDGPQQEWTAEKLKHYSIEGKHVFLELVQPSKSIDFHAGAKDTATEIVTSLGELAGAARAVGLREVIAAGTGGTKQGRMLYDFMAQGDDEVTVADGDEVIILDDTQSEEWWKVRRVKNGKEGVVPSSYVEATGVSSAQPPLSPLISGKSTVERNRREEERLTLESVQESIKEGRKQEERDLEKTRQVGPGLKLPNRASSLTPGTHDEDAPSYRNKRDSRVEGRSQSAKEKPDPTKTRVWTDRSGSFKVDAQFIGLRDGKIQLHKTNGVKIAVPVAKMATADLEFVERETGRSLDEDKPLSDLVKRKSQNSNNKPASPKTATNSQSSKTDYDWFDFFLKCGVNPYQCEGYSRNFNKDSMDEGILPDITPGVLRNLGLKEGDILRVMKYLDTKFGRTGGKQKGRNVSFGGEEVIGRENNEGSNASSPGGIFSGPGGALRNNTRKGRPAPALQTNDTVDAKALRKSINKEDDTKPLPKVRPESPDMPGPVPPLKDDVGFEDDAWDLKPQLAARQQRTIPLKTSSPTLATSRSSPPPQLTGSMADLSLLTQPLQPVVTHNNSTQQQSPSTNTTHEVQQQKPQQQEQQQGATPQFFSQIAAQQQASQSLQSSVPQPTGQIPIGLGSRQRPSAPVSLQQGGLAPPPPVRPLSAPQNINAQSNFGPPPLHPQLTGAPGLSGPQVNTSSQSFTDANKNRFQPTGPFTYQPQDQLRVQFANSFSPQLTGITLSQQTNSQVPGMTMSQPVVNGGAQMSLRFTDGQVQPQVTGLHQGPSQYTNNGMSTTQSASINSLLQAPLQPQNTATPGFSGIGLGGAGHSTIVQPFMHHNTPPIPPIPQTIAATVPLQPQKTGPAPAVKFGVSSGTKPLVAQPTGRRANLAQATPDNPFGF